MYKTKVIKATNRDRILECLFRNPCISRKDISDLTGITPATVTTTVAAMVEEKLLVELGRMEEDRGTIGRSRIALDVNPLYCWVIGVECTLSALTACVTDLRGKILYRKTTPYTLEMGQNITRLVIESVIDCIAASGLPVGTLAGIGIAVPGHMDRECRHLVSNNALWTNLDGTVIQEAFPVPVVFENNVRCMAVSRYLHDPANTPSNFALFHVGRGMYCAHIADDELYIGSTYSSGEIAHTIAIPDGKRCECGKRGCLQTVATEEALLENAAVIFQKSDDTMLRSFARAPEALTVEHILTAYDLGDLPVRRMMTQVLRHLCIAALNVAILMNPEKIYFHGRLFNHESIQNDILEQIREQFDFEGNNYQLGSVSFWHADITDGAVGGAALAILKCVIHM